MFGKKNPRPLRVLHLPVNIRWVLDAIVKGQNELGIETKRWYISKMGVDNVIPKEIHLVRPRKPEKRFGDYPRYIIHLITHFGSLFWHLIWADVVHWQFCNRAWLDHGRFKDIDFKMIKALDKTFVSHFHGTDFRNNDFWMQFNPWWYESADEETMAKYNELAERTQNNFGEAGAHFAMSYGIFTSVKKKYLKSSSILDRSVDVTSIPPRDSYEIRDKVVITHAPSNPQKKGTEHVKRIVAEIMEIRDVEFRLIVDMTRDEVLEALRGADIAIDQIISGNYGIFSVEAMASGAAVVSDIADCLMQSYPEGMPVVSANPDNLKEVLLELIDNPEKRIEIAKRGREYAYRVHSIEETIPEVLRVYRKAALAKGKHKVVEKIDYHLKLAEDKGWKGISAGKEAEEVPKVWRLTHE